MRLNRWRHRVNVFGKVILQRAVRTMERPDCPVIIWVDAVSTDLADFDGYRKPANQGEEPCQLKQ
jgi:hypothetical protein